MTFLSPLRNCMTYRVIAQAGGLRGARAEAGCKSNYLMARGNVDLGQRGTGSVITSTTSLRSIQIIENSWSCCLCDEP